MNGLRESDDTASVFVFAFQILYRSAVCLGAIALRTD